MATRGRKRLVIDEDQFENLCRMQCTESEIAAWFRCSVDALCKWCKRNYGMTFEAVFAEFKECGKISLRRSQFKMAQTNPSMAIFLGKNYLGQSDDPRKYARDETTEDKLDRFLDVLTDAMTVGDDSDEQD